MTRKVINVALNGVTGRMGYRQHLERSLLSIRARAASRSRTARAIYPSRSWSGGGTTGCARSPSGTACERWSTSLDEVLSDPAVDVYFDTQVTSAREASLAKAIAAGKHVYTEKPSASTLDGALRLASAAREAGITNGVVQDKLFLPGMIKLRRLVRSGFFGRVLSARLEFGYWVFEGDDDRRAAAVVELPQGGRRRDRARHVPALAVPARGPVRPDHGAVRPAHDARAAAVGRVGTRPTR